MNEPRSNIPDTTDLGAAEAWQVFEVRLAAYLSTMVDPDEDDHLIVEIPGRSDEEGATPYAQFAGFDGGMIRAEVTGNHYLADPYRLDEQQVLRLRADGWQGGDSRELNHYLEASVSEASMLASRAVSALRDVFEIPHPDLLSMQVWGPASDGAAVLGLRRSEDVPGDVVDGKEPPPLQMVTLPLPTDHAQLFALVRDTLREKLDEEPIVDGDEDFVLSHLGQPVYVRVRKETPAVEVFARVVHEVYSRRQTAMEIALLNRDSAWIAWKLREREVWQHAIVEGQPYVATQLLSTLDVFFQAMDQTRGDLALRTRGSEA